MLTKIIVQTHPYEGSSRSFREHSDNQNMTIFWVIVIFLLISFIYLIWPTKKK